MGKANLNDVLTLLRGWSDSEFAEAASGEFCEDLKTMIEGAISRALDPTTDASGLVERLERQAIAASEAQRWLAESKSLRQESNHEGRTDLYMFAKPEQTLEGQAATHITTLTARLSDKDAEIARLTREIDAARAAGAASMQERCARVAEETDTGWADARTFTAQKIAKAIRSLT